MFMVIVAILELFKRRRSVLLFGAAVGKEQDAATAAKIDLWAGFPFDDCCDFFVLQLQCR